MDEFWTMVFAFVSSPLQCFHIEFTGEKGSACCQRAAIGILPMATYHDVESERSAGIRVRLAGASVCLVITARLAPETAKAPPV